MTDVRRRSPVLFHRPRLRLSQLVRRRGGISRELAIERALAAIEELRAQSLERLDELVGALEDLSTVCSPRAGNPCNICLLADEIISIAVTFSLSDVAHVAKMLCDLAVAFRERGVVEVEPIVVHVRALRLLLSADTQLSPSSRTGMLSELMKISHHFGITPQEEPEDWLIEYCD